MNHSIYQNPLNTRYASEQMSSIWSAQKKHSTWRKLWIALAEAERELGLDISQEQIGELKAHRMRSTLRTLQNTNENYDTM